VFSCLAKPYEKENQKAFNHKRGSIFFYIDSPDYFYIVFLLQQVANKKNPGEVYRRQSRHHFFNFEFPLLFAFHGLTSADKFTTL